MLVGGCRAAKGILGQDRMDLANLSLVLVGWGLRIIANCLHLILPCIRVRVDALIAVGPILKKVLAPESNIRSTPCKA